MPDGEFSFKFKYVSVCYFSLECTLISVVLTRQAALVLFVRLDEVRSYKQTTSGHSSVSLS